MRMKPDEMREKLICGTARVIATEGLDKATTKQIGLTTSINEAYIYRLFKDKEDLFAKTFAYLDDELVSLCMTYLPIMKREDLAFRERGRLYFAEAWRFLLANSVKCRAFIRYYYSPYFAKYSATEHRERYVDFLEKFKVCFKEDANVWMILNHILDTMLSFAVKVFDGALPDNLDTEEHVFRLVYASSQQYFKDENSQDTIKE